MTIPVKSDRIRTPRGQIIHKKMNRHSKPELRSVFEGFSSDDEALLTQGEEGTGKSAEKSRCEAAGIWVCYAFAG